MSSNADYDSDEDIEFEDVPLTTPARSQGPDIIDSPEAEHSGSSFLAQRSAPFPSGSYEENQIRGQLNSGLERIDLRLMKARLGIDIHTLPTETRYLEFTDLSADVDRLVNILWISATPSIQIEGLLALAGITEEALSIFDFEPEPVLTILHKFDLIFVALCTCKHPVTQELLPGAVEGQSFATQTQQVRMRSLAEATRSKVFQVASFGSSDDSLEEEEEGNEDEDEDEDESSFWMMALTYIYERTLMSLPI
ncbi:hypothetical protein N7493_002934 [Penicillium malachiteum]|uniref:Uncharacterized protein n=1 Tax=Penicillium malachiteum TaxID=1324776 RepID=A0AAD6HTF0_9EURO|nr:hypothetical protein N7493_002934 [Penicillium malachiteum]